MTKNKRKQGEGMLRLRKDGRWEGRIVVGYDEKGNPKSKGVFAKTKTDAGMRKILLPRSVATLLQEKRKHAVSEWIFPHYANPSEPLHPDTAYRKLKALLSKANLPSIRFHDLRHTFATHAMQGGVDAKTLAGILGHTDASFTLDTYTHVTSDMQKNASAVVNNMMQQFLITEKTNEK